MLRFFAPPAYAQGPTSLGAYSFLYLGIYRFSVLVLCFVSLLISVLTSIPTDQCQPPRVADMASPIHAINTGNVSPRRTQGASKLPVVSGRGASASPGKMGETYTSFQPSTGPEAAQKSRMSRIPTATTPKHSATVPNLSPASCSARVPATSRLSTITAKSAESFRFPSRFGLRTGLSKVCRSTTYESPCNK